MLSENQAGESVSVQGKLIFRIRVLQSLFSSLNVLFSHFIRDFNQLFPVVMPLFVPVGICVRLYAAQKLFESLSPTPPVNQPVRMLMYPVVCVLTYMPKDSCSIRVKHCP